MQRHWQTGSALMSLRRRTTYSSTVEKLTPGKDMRMTLRKVDFTPPSQGNGRPCIPAVHTNESWHFNALIRQFSIITALLILVGCDVSHKYNAADSIPREALVVNDPKYCLSKEELASLKHGEVTIADAEKLRLYYEFCKLDWKSAHE